MKLCNSAMVPGMSGTEATDRNLGKLLRELASEQPSNLVDLAALLANLHAELPALAPLVDLDTLCQAVKPLGCVVHQGAVAVLRRQAPKVHPNPTEAIRGRLTARWAAGDTFTRRQLQQAVHGGGIGGPQITTAIDILLAEGVITTTTYRDAAGRNRICYQVRGKDTPAAWE